MFKNIEALIEHLKSYQNLEKTHSFELELHNSKRIQFQIIKTQEEFIELLHKARWDSDSSYIVDQNINFRLLPSNSIQFKNPITCKYWIFLKKIDMWFAQFFNTISFSHAVFLKGSDFMNVKFHKPVDFSHTVFNQTPGFHGAHFFHKVILENTDFREGAAFYNCSFDSGLDLKSTFFKHKVDFGSSQFKEAVDFRNVTFPAYSNFYQAHFFKNALFNSCKFESDISFGKSIFEKSALFDNSTFSNKINFSETCFNGDLSLQKANGLHNIVFSKAHINKKYIWSLKDKGCRLDLSNIILNSSGCFEESHFEHIDFTGTIFKKCPVKEASFINCNFTGAIFNFTDTINWDCDLETDLNTQYIFRNYTVVYNPACLEFPEFQNNIYFKIKAMSNPEDLEFLEFCYEEDFDQYEYKLKSCLKDDQLVKLWSIIEKTGYQNPADKQLIKSKESRIPQGGTFGDENNKDFYVSNFLNTLR